MEIGPEMRPTDSLNSLSQNLRAAMGGDGLGFYLEIGLIDDWKQTDDGSETKDTASGLLAMVKKENWKDVLETGRLKLVTCNTYVH
jgi:hypothetical protein